MESAILALIGVAIGGIIGLIGTVMQTRIASRETRMAARRDYLMGLMQQLIECRMEFQQVLASTSYQYNELVKPVAKATAIAHALGNDEISIEIEKMSSTSVPDYGLRLVDYVIQQVSQRIKKLGGV